jgi:4-aminobutyrate aminotransferase/(S)-3-amino-2-methylpropionate transaminase
MVPIEDPRFVLGSHGADAVEAALQTALLFTGKPGVVAFEGGYHGLSLGALSVCGYKLGFRAPFAAKLDGHVRFVPYPRTPSEAAASLSRLEAELSRGDVGAVLIEPVLGRGGVFVPPEGALASIAARARAAGALLIADEIWTGLGRTGVQWASEEAGMRPDILCLGKALGGGLPISACAARREVMAAWGAPTGEAIRTATFLGHPLACAAALAHLDALEARDAPRLAREHGAILQSALEARLGGRFPIRGRAMALAIELGSMGRTFGVMRALLERGWITLPAGPDATALQLSRLSIFRRPSQRPSPRRSPDRCRERPRSQPRERCPRPHHPDERQGKAAQRSPPTGRALGAHRRVPSGALPSFLAPVPRPEGALR